jgi:hypothetical protein
MDAASVQLKRNQALAWRAWMAYDAHDLEAFAACITADWVEHHFARADNWRSWPPEVPRLDARPAGR